MNIKRKATIQIALCCLAGYLIGALAVASLWYAVDYRSVKPDISANCTMEDAVQVKDVTVASRLLCKRQSVNAIAIKKGDKLHFLPTEHVARFFDLTSDKDHLVLLFRVLDSSKCGYHYQVIDVTKNVKVLGVVNQCTDLIRLTLYKGSLYVMVPSNDIRDGYMKSLVFPLNAKSV